MTGVVFGWNLLLVRLLRQERLLAQIKRSARRYIIALVWLSFFAVLLVAYS